MLVEKMVEFIPDDDERTAFGERAVEEYRSGRYRFSFQMYKSRCKRADSRHMVIGRKPNVELDFDRSKQMHQRV